MTAVLERVEITAPGVYDIPADLYHQDPVPGGSLSSSGARRLLPPSCPALFRYEQDNPQPTRRVFEIGHAAHAEALGTGPELVLVDRDRWDTKEIKGELAEIRARGAVPLKTAEYQQIKDMAAALRAHPMAAALFNPEHGKAEQSLFWTDHYGTGVTRRARFDWLRTAPSKSRVIIPDYKSARSAEPSHLQKAIHEYGYNLQAAWYLDGARTLGLADETARMVFVCQEKTPPYLVTVAEPDEMSMRKARQDNHVALLTYAECVANGRWPGYTDDVALIPLPVWVENQYLAEVNR